MTTPDVRDMAHHPWFSGDAHEHGPDGGRDGSLLTAEQYVQPPSRNRPAVDDAIAEVNYGTITVANTNAHMILAFDPDRESFSVYNLGPGNIYIGSSRGIKAAGGNTTIIQSGGKLNEVHDRNDVYVIADQANTMMTYTIQRYGHG